MSEFYTWSSENEVSVHARQRDHIVDLIFLKFKSLNNMLYLKLEQVDEKDFVVEGNNNFIQFYFKLFNFRAKGHISDYFLSFFEE